MTPWITKPVPFNIGQGAAVAEAGATTYPDSFGTDGNATTDGVTINTSDQKIGDGCISCSTDKENVIIANAQVLTSGTGDFTYSMWINFASFGAANQEILRETSTPGNPSYEALYGGAGKIIINGVDLVSTSALSVDTWYLLQSVRSGGTETSYLNYDAHTVSNGSPSTIRTSDEWGIGGRPNESEGFGGLIDSVVVFHRALTDQERSDIYASGSPSTIAETFTTLASRDELKLWYSCDALSGSDLINDAIPVT